MASSWLGGGGGGSKRAGTPPPSHRGRGQHTCIPGEPQPGHPRRDPAPAVLCTTRAVTFSLGDSIPPRWSCQSRTPPDPVFGGRAAPMPAWGLSVAELIPRSRFSLRQLKSRRVSGMKSLRRTTSAFPSAPSRGSFTTACVALPAHPCPCPRPRPSRDGRLPLCSLPATNGASSNEGTVLSPLPSLP